VLSKFVSAANFLEGLATLRLSNGGDGDGGRKHSLRLFIDTPFALWRRLLGILIVKRMI
jgi:hypothetical protein